MLLQFSVKNYKTFKDKATLSLMASNYDKETREEENIYLDQVNNFRIAKSAVIYGANASGKSKLLEAFSFVRYFVINSSKESQKGEKIETEPFLLNEDSENAPSEFEVIFVHDNILYRYGFETDDEKVISEWLYHKPKTKEVELFYREGNNFHVHARSFAKGSMLVRENLVRDNALLLSVAAQFNEKTAALVIEWFKRFQTISGLNETGYQGYTMRRSEDIHFKQKILDLLQAADFGIQDLHVEKVDADDLPKNMPKDLREKMMKDIKDGNAQYYSDVYTTHRKYDAHKNPVGNVLFSLDEDESSGTKKFFALTGPILDVLENGYTLVVDELDSKLHPNLVCKIVSLFNSKEFNKKNAQLIFNTHDTNLLSSGLFRRDQVWFTEKNRLGEAKLFSLADFKSTEVRKNENFEDNYLEGKYGAVPYLGFFDQLNQTLAQYENER